MNDDNQQALLQKLSEAVVNGEAEQAEDLVRAGLSSGLDAQYILNEGLIPAMTEVGYRFENLEYFLPEMLVSANAMQKSVEVLQPELIKEGVKPVAKVVLGTVKGDLHDIGKNLVSIMLKGAGFEVLDIGTNVTADDFVQAAKDGAQLVGISALLTTTMSEMQKIIHAFEVSGLHTQIKIMVGGAPVTQTFADEIGADGYAEDAARAARLAKHLLGIP